MSEKLVELAAARGSRLAQTLAHPLSAVAEALMSLSGEAHRDVVISRMARPAIVTPRWPARPCATRS